MSEHILLHDSSDAEITRWWTLAGACAGSAEKMWNTWNDPRRGHLDMALACLPQVQRLYECGCGAGPNLRRIQESHPLLTLGGSDPCEELARFASLNLCLPIARTALPVVPDATWDTVLFAYTLAYLSPDVAHGIFRRLYMQGTQAIILMEPTASFDVPEGQWTREVRDDGSIMVPEWVHDYPALLAETGWDSTWCWPVLPHAQLCNSVRICERADRALPQPYPHISTRVPEAAEPLVSASPLGHPVASGTTLTP